MRVRTGKPARSDNASRPGPQNFLGARQISDPNMEKRGGLNLEFFYENVGSHVKPARDPNNIRAFLQTYKEIENADTHFQLQKDLIEHHWQRAGQ
ncbi:hypothetical protein ZWY2020_029840 [Hordeum vulgare]|nr:hypothetical protein ZWY2020_029840 [Hordeum vulgare]